MAKARTSVNLKSLQPYAIGAVGAAMIISKPPDSLKEQAVKWKISVPALLGLVAAGYLLYGRPPPAWRMPLIAVVSVGLASYWLTRSGSHTLSQVGELREAGPGEVRDRVELPLSDQRVALPLPAVLWDEED